MIKQLVLVAVGAMLVLNVSAREVKKGKCRCKQFRNEQRFDFRRPVAVQRDIRFEDARRMGRFEATRCKNFRRADMRPCDARKGDFHRHHRHHGRHGRR